jgi:hypothetical protein
LAIEVIGQSSECANNITAKITKVFILFSIVCGNRLQNDLTHNVANTPCSLFASS